MRCVQSGLHMSYGLALVCQELAGDLRASVGPVFIRAFFHERAGNRLRFVLS